MVYEKKICLVELMDKLISIELYDEDYIEYRDIEDAVLNEVFGDIHEFAEIIYKLARKNVKSKKEEEFLIYEIEQELKRFLKIR